MNNKETLTKIASFVRAERGRNDISQAVLSEKSGVSVRSIVSIEKGEFVRMSTLSKVLESLGFEIKHMVEFISIQKKETPE